MNNIRRKFQLCLYIYIYMIIFINFRIHSNKEKKDITQITYS